MTNPVDKWGYIERISNGWGSEMLLKLMDRYEANNLRELTEAEVRAFWEELNRE